MRAAVIILSLAVAGCSQADGPATADRSEADVGLQSVPVVERARSYVAGWKGMGMYLPDAQVPFFASNLTAVSGVLSEALFDRDERVRQRAAYVVAELRGKAASLEPAIVGAIAREPTRLVRMYLYRALGAVGATNETSKAALKERFDRLPRDDSRGSEDDYTAADERIDLASALYVLSSNEQAKQQYLTEVTQWLKPPSMSLDAAAL